MMQDLNKTSDYINFQITDTSSASGFADQATQQINLIKPKQLIGLNFFTYFNESATLRTVPLYSQLELRIFDPLPYGKVIELTGGTGTILQNELIKVFGNTNFDFYPLVLTRFSLDFMFRDAAAVSKTVKWFLTMYFTNYQE